MNLIETVADRIKKIVTETLGDAVFTEDVNHHFCIQLPDGFEILKIWESDGRFAIYGEFLNISEVYRSNWIYGNLTLKTYPEGSLRRVLKDKVKRSMNRLHEHFIACEKENEREKKTIKQRFKYIAALKQKVKAGN